MADSEDEIPPERDVKDFSFKQMRKIRMFEAPQSMPTFRSSLLAVSSKYGLTFVGCPTGLKLIKTETIERIHESEEGSMQNVVAHCPSSFIDIGHSVQFVGLSGDDLTLSVCYENGKNTVMALFDVPTLGSPGTSNAKFGEIALSSDAGVSVLDIAWNPGFPALFAVCLSSGAVFMMELTDTEIKTVATLPANLKASAICWSPKGKQLVVGHKDGRLTQYSQVLQVKKEINTPDMFTDDFPHWVTDILWISTTLFAVVYSSFEDGDCPKFLLVSTPKNEPVQITNLDDIYYMMSDDREPAFYLKNVIEWSLVVSACSNGLEAAVVGKYGGEAATPWEKWSFEEDCRPVMPLTNDNDETFPMGLAIDFSSTRPFVKGEQRLPPAPIIMILSTDGVLCPFHVINEIPNTNYGIVKPPEPLPLGGQRKTVVSKMDDRVSQATTVAVSTEKSPLQPGPISLGTSANLPIGAFSFASGKQTIPGDLGPALSGMSVGAFSLGSSKQPPGTVSSGTPVASAPSAFAFASPKQNVPLVSIAASSGNIPASAFSFASPKPTVPSSSGAVFAGGTPASAFSLPGQKQVGVVAVKPSQSAEEPATESAKPSATPQLVKPVPTSKTQFNLPGSPAVLSASAKATMHSQGVSLDDQPKAMSSVPSQVTAQGLPAQPKPTPAQQPVTKPLTMEPDGQSEKTTSAGFKLPGQATVTAKTTPEVEKKDVPISKGNVIEDSVSEHIHEAISLFNKEMDTLRDSVRKMESKCRLTEDNKDLRTLRKTTDDINRSLEEIKDTTKVQHKDIDEEKRKLFEAFEMLEDARIRQERKNDPRYVQLLKSRALDPINTSKMRGIRNLHLYLDKTLREVNMVLDEQWNKENERKRSIQRPALDEIYQTLKINHKIAQDQGAKLEKITEEMKNRRLLSTSWQRNSVNTAASFRDDSSSMSDPFAEHKELKPSPLRTAAPISPEKQAQLRSMFQKRRSTPVRRSTIVPTTVAKTPPSVKPTKPQVPFLSSTPAVNQEATADEQNISIRFNLPTTAQQEESDADGSDSESEEESQSEDYEPQEDEEELERLSAASKMPDAGPVPSAAATGFSIGGATFVPGASATAVKDTFSAAVVKDELNKPTAQSVRLAAADSTQADPTPHPTPTAAFSSVVKPAGSQGTSNTTEPAKTSGGLLLPASKEQPSPATVAPSKVDFTPNVNVISSDTPPNVAAAMAAINRASATQSATLPSNSNLDPSASIEPVTLVAYKPQAQGSVLVKDLDAENTAAKAIANAALVAATAEAQKPSTKPQCSTEFVFKSTDSGKPGPPVVTFKPPNASPQTPGSGSAVAPNVTVNPMPTFKPAFGPGVPSSSTVSGTGGLQLLGTSSPFSQLPTSTPPSSFAPPTGGLFNLGSSPGTTSSAPSQLSFSVKGSDVKPASQIPAVSAAAAPSAAGTVASAASITPSARVSRNLFASEGVSSQAALAGQQHGDSKESSVQVTAASSSIASSSGVVTPATTAAAFAFSAPAPSSGGFFKNLGLSGNTSSAFGSGEAGSGSTSILSALMRSSGAGSSGNLLASVPNAASNNAPSAPTSASPLLSKGIPSENKDASTATLTTPSSVGIPAGAGGVFAQALSESSKSGPVVSLGSTVSTVPATTSIFGATATTAASGSVGLFGLPPGGTTTGVTAPSTTTTASNLLGLSAGSPSSAFSATSTASPFFSSINPASTTASVPVGSSPLNTISTPQTTGGTTSAATSTLTSAPSGLFGKASSATSAFGAVPSSGGSGFGSLGTAATTSAGGRLFGTPASTAFAPTSVFGTSSGQLTFGSPQPFSSSAGSQGSTFGSAPVFGSASTAAGTALTFGSATSTAGTGSAFGSASTTAGTGLPFASKPAFGQSSFGPTTSSSFGQTASKPAENALGFGFGGFGLGGQASSQNSNANPFGVAQGSQGFSASTTSQPSLFGGKSAADIFKMGAVSSGPFSQSGLGSQSSGGFSGSSFTSQGGGVLSSGFGFGSTSSAGSSGFGSSQPFGSPSAGGGGSVFGGAPAFGSNPSFGGAPAFGSSSPQGGLGATPSGGIFASGSSGGFGQSSGSPTFGSLASQSNIPSFGAIAGQSPTQGFGSFQPQQQQSPSFGSFGGGSQSPSGASFSRWR